LPKKYLRIAPELLPRSKRRNRIRQNYFEEGHERYPQGSVLSPACWNIMFDGLLRRLERVTPGQFAEDLIVVINGNSRSEIEQRGQKIVDEILDWCRLAKLKISKSKSEGITLKCEKIRKAPIGRRGGDRSDRKRKQVRERKVDLANRPPVIKETKV